MFGQNPIRPVLRDPDFLAVEEVFFTLQGEGPFSGRPALFIRLAGCNLACHFCDTQFESKAEMPQSTTLLMAYIQGSFTEAQRRLVVLTGGEPLRQDCSALIRNLLATGTDVVQIETAGTVWQDGIDFAWLRSGRLLIVCSPKTPKVHPKIAQFCDHWKYVVRGGQVDLEDGLPNHGTQIATMDKLQRIYRPVARHCENIWISPCDEQDPALNAVNRDLARDICLQHGYRLNLQIHKIVNVR